jgi:hypothetical protein
MDDLVIKTLFRENDYGYTVSVYYKSGKVRITCYIDTEPSYINLGTIKTLTGGDSYTLKEKEKGI